MSKSIHRGLAGIAAFCAAAALAGQNAPHVPPIGKLKAALQIKQGLWEFDDTPSVSGDTLVSDVMLGKIPLSQRAQYLAQMRKMMAAPHKDRECVNQTVFEQRLSSFGSGCRQVVISNTASRLEVHSECRAENGGMMQQEDRKIVATSPTNVSTSVRANITQGNKAMTVNSIESGRWLSSNCDNVHGIQQLQ